MLNTEALLAGYRRAGTDFLADRLAGLFAPITNPEDQALHNVILKEVIQMMGEDEDDQKRFFRTLALRIQPEKRREKKRMSFAKIVAETLIPIGKG